MSMAVATFSLSRVVASSSACLYAWMMTVGCIFSSRNWWDTPSVSAAPGGEDAPDRHHPGVQAGA